MDVLSKLASAVVALLFLVMIPAPIWVGIIVVLPFVVTIVAFLVAVARH